MFALNIAEDGRVLSATFAEHAQGGMIEVDALPDGDIANYRLVDEEFVYDPLPPPDEEEIPTLESRMASLENAQKNILEAISSILQKLTDRGID